MSPLQSPSQPDQASMRETTSSVLPPHSSNRPAVVTGLAIVVLLAGMAVWYPVSDRHAPYGTGAAMTAPVTQIAPRVSGPVVEILVKDNDQVVAGQPLFRIDPTTFRFDVTSAEASLAQARQSMEASASAVRAANSQLERATISLGLAQDARDRAEALHRRGVMSDARFDQVEGDLRAARAAAEAASADVERLAAQGGPMTASNPQLMSAEAALERARFALDHTTVVAPADGFITNLSLSIGQFAAAGQAVLTFIDPSDQVLMLDLRESQLMNVQPGDPVDILFQARPGEIWTGTVDSIAWGIAPQRASVGGLAQSSTDTRWFPPARKVPVRINLDAAGALPANVRLGSEASAVIHAGGDGGPVSLMARGLMRLRSWIAIFG